MSHHPVISTFFPSLSLILTVSSLQIKKLQNFQLLRLTTHLLFNTELFPDSAWEFCTVFTNLSRGFWGGLCDGHNFVLLCLQNISGIVV